MSNLEQGYLGNTKLRRPGIRTQWTQEQAMEFMKCASDPVYFMETYVKIMNIDSGVINFTPRRFQKELANAVFRNRFVIAKIGRQQGKSTTIAAFVLHYIIFNTAKTVAILANKGETAREILGRVQFAYENLPKWMQHGILEYNKGSFLLENQCRVIAAASSANAIRGYSISMLLLDEAAHFDSGSGSTNWDQFFAAVYPTISSGKESKIVMISTPKGYNHFHTFWLDAMEKRNGFIPVESHWSEIPGRDKKWEKQERAILGDTLFEQEHECSFLGSVMTLVNPKKLDMLRAKKPFYDMATGLDLKLYTEVVDAKATYVLVADVSHGKGMDYHAFSVIDISTQPFQQVAAFRNNMISPIEYGEVVYRTAKRFNDAYVLIELNDMGQQVSRVVKSDLEYQNVIHVLSKGRSGQVPCFWHSKGEAGVKTSVTTKAIGCNMAKHLIEHNILIINDQMTINELSTFVRSDKARESYCAQEGKNDDTVMPLVLFGWLTNSQFFADLTNSAIRDQLRMESEAEINNMSTPIGYLSLVNQDSPLVGHKIDPNDKDNWFLVDNDPFNHGVDRDIYIKPYF